MIKHKENTVHLLTFLYCLNPKSLVSIVLGNLVSVMLASFKVVILMLM